VYIAFNKKTAEEAKMKFPSHVECTTFHSLAYRGVNSYKKFKDRLVPKLSLSIIIDAFELKDLEVLSSIIDFQHERIKLTETGLNSGAYNKLINRFAWTILSTVQEYCHSLSPDIVPVECETFKREAVLMYSKTLWKLMSASKSVFPVTHDVYVKLWVNSSPTINADFILFDEAQDTDPLMCHTVSIQEGQKIWVGDTWQQIYRWRKAVNSLKKVEGDILRLTQSFRFGPAIASTATNVLKQLGETVPVVGYEQAQSHVESASLQGVIDSVSFTEDAPEYTRAFLCRSNLEVLDWVRYNHERYHIVMQGVQEVLSVLFDLSSLASKKGAKGPLVTFKDLDDFLDFVKETKDGALTMLLSLFAEDTPLEEENSPYTFSKNKLQVYIDILMDIKNNKETDDVYKPVVNVSTMHRAKGLEWDEVAVLYTKPLTLQALAEKRKIEANKISTYELKHLILELQDELKLIYVALTRAKKRLILDHDLYQFLNSGKDAFDIAPFIEHLSPLQVEELLAFLASDKEEVEAESSNFESTVTTTLKALL
jgi:hypothetical protein